MKKHILLACVMVLSVMGGRQVTAGPRDGVWKKTETNRDFILKSRSSENDEDDMRVRRSGRRQRNYQQVTEEEETEFLKKLKDTDSDKYDKLVAAREKSPRGYKRAVRFGVKQQRRMESLKEKDPASYERIMKQMSLNKELKSLSGEYKSSTEKNEKKEIESKMNEKLKSLYELRTDQRKNRIDKISKKLENMQKEMEERENNKNEIIRRKLEEITGKASRYKW